MLTDVMLCISFVVGMGIMYLVVHKMARIMSDSFIDETIKAEQMKEEELPEERVYREGLKPRISLRSQPRRKDKRNTVSVGNARPYRVNMKKI